MNIISKLRSMYGDFTKIERKIADFILENNNEVPLMSIGSFSSVTNVSSTSISRFMRKRLNCSYSEMKVYLTKETSNEKNSQITRVLSWADEIEVFPKKLSDEIANILKDVVNENESKVYQEVIQDINQAKTVYIMGIGASSPIAQDFQQKLLKIGIRAFYLIDNNLNMINVNQASGEDIVVAISYSGRTKEINNVINVVKQRGTRIIAITSELDTRLTSLSDRVLYIPSFEKNEMRLSSILSKYGNSFIIDIIFIGLAKLRINEPSTFADNYLFLIEGLKEDKNE